MQPTWEQVHFNALLLGCDKTGGCLLLHINDQQIESLAPQAQASVDINRFCVGDDRKSVGGRIRKTRKVICMSHFEEGSKESQNVSIFPYYFTLFSRIDMDRESNGGMHAV